MNFFSNKFSFEPEETELFHLFNQKKLQGEKILDLTISNPTHCGFDYSPLEIPELLSGSENLQYNPDPKGHILLRESIVDYYSQKNREVSADHIFLTCGTSESISFLWKLFCNPGDSVICSTPGYPLFDFLAELENVQLRKFFLFLDSNGEWRIDFDSLKSLLVFNPKVLMLVQPNNPTGSIVNPLDFQKLEKMAIENNLIIILDEVFSDFIYEPVSFHAETEYAPSIYLNGFSKTLCLPQMKLGWFYTKGFGNQQKRFNEYMEIITDSFLSVNTMIQNIGPHLLKRKHFIQDQVKARIQKNISIAQSYLSKDLSITIPIGGWYLTISILNQNIPSDKFSYLLLKNQNVYVHPGSMFEYEDLKIVISLLIDSNEFQKGMERLSSSIARESL